MKSRSLLIIFVCLLGCSQRDDLVYWSDTSLDSLWSRPDSFVAVDKELETEVVYFFTRAKKYWGYFRYKDGGWSGFLPLSDSKSSSRMSFFRREKQLFLIEIAKEGAQVWSVQGGVWKRSDQLIDLKCEGLPKFSYFNKKIYSTCTTPSMKLLGVDLLKIPIVSDQKIVLQGIKERLEIFKRGQSANSIEGKILTSNEESRVIYVPISEVKNFSTTVYRGHLIMAVEGPRKALSFFTVLHGKVVKWYSLPLLQGYSNPKLVTANNTVHLFADQFNGRQLHAMRYKGNLKDKGVLGFLSEKMTFLMK